MLFTCDLLKDFPLILGMETGLFTLVTLLNWRPIGNRQEKKMKSIRIGNEEKLQFLDTNYFKYRSLNNV